MLSEVAARKIISNFKLSCKIIVLFFVVYVGEEEQ